MAHKFFEFVLTVNIMFSLFLSCLSMSTRLKIYLEVFSSYTKIGILPCENLYFSFKVCCFQPKFS